MNRAPQLIAVWLACSAVLASGPAIAQTARMAAPDALDDVVDEGELQRQQQARTPLRMKYPDFVTVTRRTKSGKGLINLRVQPHTQQREIRFRASDARQLAEGGNSLLRLERDRLTKDGANIATFTLEFNAGMEEADGLPALIPINATTSLFNFDYARLENSNQPLTVTLKNAMDPQTQRCGEEVHLGIGAEDFHDHFILLGDGVGDCNRTVKSRETDLIFADAVPQHLRQELRDLHGPVFNQFSRNLGSEPGTVFVIWLPEAAGNDLRLVRGLSKTSLLVFNGPAWEHGFSAQQRDALWEEIAREQMLRRIPEPARTDAATQAAADYLLKLARAERQQATISLLTTEVPEWISACARAMRFQSGVANGPGDMVSYDCGLVVQFVYDAVVRAKSKGQDTVMRTWRTLLAESKRRRRPSVKPSVFLDSSAEARRIVQGLLSGATDWSAFAVEMDKLGVQLLATPGWLAPSVEVQSLAHFRD
jgi:hypothetical protein